MSLTKILDGLKNEFSDEQAAYAINTCHNMPSNFFASTNIEIYQWFPIEIKQYGCEIKQYGCDVPCPYNTTISCSFAVPESITITTAIVIKMMSYTLKLMFFNKRYFYGRRIIRLTRE